MSSNTIVLAGEYRKLQSKKIATGQTIYPGMLLKLTSAGELTAHATQGGYAERIIAKEDSLQGKTVDDVYTAGQIADCAIPLPGSETQVLVVAGANIAIGDQLTSAGTGKFEEVGGGDVPLCVATEACDLTDSDAVDTLCAVRWL